MKILKITLIMFLLLYVLSACAPPIKGVVEYETPPPYVRILYRDDFSATLIYTIQDKENGTLCYVFSSTHGGGIDCLVLP